MINYDNGKLSIKGNTLDICSDLACILIGVRDAFEEKFGKERAEEKIDRAIEISKMSHDEMLKEAKRKIELDALDEFVQELEAKIKEEVAKNE